MPKEVNFSPPSGRPSRKVPKPHNRPSVELDKTAREWRNVLAKELRPGDTVADAGKLSAVIKVGNWVMVTNILDKHFEWAFEDKVFAFVWKV